MSVYNTGTASSLLGLLAGVYTTLGTADDVTLNLNSLTFAGGAPNFTAGLTLAAAQSITGLGAMSIIAAAGSDIVMRMGDVAGANQITFQDSAGATRTTLDSDGNLEIQGDFTVNGQFIHKGTELSTADEFVFFNADYTADAAAPYGFFGPIDPTATNYAPNGTGFATATTVEVVTTAGLAANDFIYVTGATNVDNDALYEVSSVTATVITIKGAPTANLGLKSAFTADGTTAGTIKKAVVSWLRARTDGEWERGFADNSVGLAASFTTLATASATGTDNLTYTINQDGVAGSNEDPALILEGGDGGAEVISSLLRQDSSADALFLWTSDTTDGTTDRTTNLTLGPIGDAQAATVDADAVLTFKSHSPTAPDASTFLTASIRMDASANDFILTAPAAGSISAASNLDAEAGLDVQGNITHTASGTGDIDRAWDFSAGVTISASLLTVAAAADALVEDDAELRFGTGNDAQVDFDTTKLDLTFRGAVGVGQSGGTGTQGTGYDFNGGAGAAAVAATNTGGEGGAYTAVLGAGGAGAAGAAGNERAGGAGGAFSITAGAGGAGTGTGVGGELGGDAGNGGALSFTAGAGGAGGAGAIDEAAPGNGGSVTFAGGAGGAGTATIAGGTGGNLTLSGGAGGATGGAGAGADGNVVIRVNRDGANAFIVEDLVNLTNYLKIDTSSSPQLEFGNATDNPTARFLGTGVVDFDGNVDANAGLDITGNLTLATGTATLTANGASSFTTSAGALTLTSAAAATWSTSAGDLTLGAGADLRLAPTGEVESNARANSSAALADGDVVAQTSAGEWVKVSAATVGNNEVAFITTNAAGGAGTATDVVMPGTLCTVNTDLSAATVGDPVYIHATTTGQLTTTAPSTSGQKVVRMGTVWTAAVAGTARILYQPQFIAAIA